MELNKGKRMKINEESLTDLWDNIKCTNIHIIGVLEGEEREKGPQKISEEIIVENGANLDEGDRNLLTQQSSLEPKSKNWSSFADNTSTKEFTTQNQKSQDVGFWEGEVVKELSVEEQIKRNRYYDEDEDEE